MGLTCHPRAHWNIAFPACFPSKEWLQTMNKTPCYTTSVHYSNQASLWFTTHTALQAMERKHICGKDYSSELWKQWLKLCQSHLPGCPQDPFFSKTPPYTGQASEGPPPPWSSKQAAAGTGLEPNLIQHVCAALYRSHQTRGDATSIISKASIISKPSILSKLYSFALKGCCSLNKYLCLFQTKFVRWICNIVSVFIFFIHACVFSPFKFLPGLQ